MTIHIHRLEDTMYSTLVEAPLAEGPACSATACVTHIKSNPSDSIFRVKAIAMFDFEGQVFDSMLDTATPRSPAAPQMAPFAVL